MARKSKKASKKSGAHEPVTCRAVLDLIREFYLSEDVSDDEKGSLWDVLSALRGPDSESADMKDTTTAVIRQAAFGDLFDEFPAIMHRDDKEGAVYRGKMESAMHRGKGNAHFYRHARAAFHALELDWNCDNSKKEESK